MTHTETVSKQCIQAGRGQAGGGGEQQGIHVLGFQRCLGKGASDRLLSKRLGNLDVIVVSPAERLPVQVIVLRESEVPGSDAGAVEERQQALEIRNARELAADFVLHFGLGHEVGRERGTDRGDAWMSNERAPLSAEPGRPCSNRCVDIIHLFFKSLPPKDFLGGIFKLLSVTPGTTTQSALCSLLACLALQEVHS